MSTSIPKILGKLDGFRKFEILLNAQLTVSGQSVGTGSHVLYRVVVVFRSLVDHALTHHPRLEERTVNGTAYDLDHAMKMDVLVSTINKTIIPISYLYIRKSCSNISPYLRTCPG